MRETKVEKKPKIKINKKEVQRIVDKAMERLEWSLDRDSSAKELNDLADFIWTVKGLGED